MLVPQALHQKVHQSRPGIAKYISKQMQMRVASKRRVNHRYAHQNRVACMSQAAYRLQHPIVILHRYHWLETPQRVESGLPARRQRHGHAGGLQPTALGWRACAPYSAGCVPVRNATHASVTREMMKSLDRLVLPAVASQARTKPGLNELDVNAGAGGRMCSATDHVVPTHYEEGLTARASPRGPMNQNGGPNDLALAVADWRVSWSSHAGKPDCQLSTQQVLCPSCCALALR